MFFLFFPVLHCYFYSHLHPHDSNMMQGSDHLCPSQQQMFIFILLSFTSSSVILFLSLTLTTVRPFSEAAAHKRTRIRPLSHLLQDVILKTEAFKLDTTETSQY